MDVGCSAPSCSNEERGRAGEVREGINQGARRRGLTGKKRRGREAAGSRGCGSCCLPASGFPGEDREREKFRVTEKEPEGGRDHGKERDGAHLLAAGAVLGEELDAAAGWLLGQEEGGVEGSQLGGWAKRGGSGKIPRGMVSGWRRRDGTRGRIF